MRGILFSLGRVLATPGALAATSEEYRFACLHRHVTGDWGRLDYRDKIANDKAVAVGNRILSAYPLDPGKPSKGYGANTLWIITEADRSSTTLLLPEEY
jgi:hypothetical protein